MKRPLGYSALLLAIACAVGGWTLQQSGVGALTAEQTAVLVRGLEVGAIVFGGYGLYLLVVRGLIDRMADKRRRHDARNVVRLTFLVATAGAALAVLTEQWLGLLFSLGVVGFAVTFALQQPLFSLIGWFYVMTKRPYQVGDRIAVGDSKGDVVEVDFLVTTLWEINGELVSSNQPSGRIITLPNSTILSSQVKNYTREEFPYVWNELTVEVAYETELAFARETMARVADEYLGDEMEANIERYRRSLAETPVELEVRSRPSVNVVQEGSWVKLNLRYLVHPKRSQAVRNELYDRVLAALNDEPERVKFPQGRSR